MKYSRSWEVGETRIPVDERELETYKENPPACPECGDGGVPQYITGAMYHGILVLECPNKHLWGLGRNYFSGKVFRIIEKETR